VRAYQVRGHHVAELDPLGILDADLDNIRPAELELSHYGWSERDLEKQFALGPGILPHFATEERKSMTLREIIKTCRRIYCMPLRPIYTLPGTLKMIQAGPLESSTSTYQTRTSVTGSVNASRCPNPGITPAREADDPRPTHVVGIIRKVHREQVPE